MFQFHWCGFGPPITHLIIVACRARKTQFSLYIKKIKIVLELCKQAHFLGNYQVDKLYKRTYALKSIYIVKIYIYSNILYWEQTMWDGWTFKYFTINVYIHNIESILEHRFFYNIFSSLYSPQTERLAKVYVCFYVLQN